ncbi:Monocarboxylate transporter 13 [Amphibalanus amphitrite]|uniref:Monocarboxylate transporter 13 n=1 Tax=Amphibalanus amphitrite TaxID=1232801 RepID=A0A6A4W691_AMPAM|nr:Monocarboxylate transporter 13 [Amphibalanus amphitrite]
MRTPIISRYQFRISSAAFVDSGPAKANFRCSGSAVSQHSQQVGRRTDDMDGGSRARRLWDGARRLPRGGVIAVAAGFLLHLSLGIMYTYGNLTTYLTSYLHVRLGLSVDYGDTMWIGAVQSICQGPGVLLGSVCCRRFGPRLTILAGSVLCSVGMALTCLTVQTSFATTTLSYGLMSGVGIGLAYTSPLMVGYQWFPHNRGVVSGVVVGGYGLGSIILTSVQTSYLNPENVSPEDDGFFHDDALAGPCAVVVPDTGCDLCCSAVVWSAGRASSATRTW